jgi:hypothetical protein
MLKTKTKVKAAKSQSAIALVQKSGLELVRARKSRGKPATLRDYATIDFKPWSQIPGKGPTEFIPSDDEWRFHGTTCRTAHAICLKTREDLIAMHGKAEHETIDAMMAGLLETSEALKELVQMCDAAYTRVLASAAAAHKAGVKFKFADGKPARRKSVQS